MSILSNVFDANISFNKPIERFDFYVVDGVEPRSKRYELLGIVVSTLQYLEKTPFSIYTPSEKEDYIIGYLSTTPKKQNFKVNGLGVRYIGKKELPNFSPAFRTLTELLNKTKFWELRHIMWFSGFHTVYPKKWKNLERLYPGCGLGLFRGPYFRYNVLPSGKIVLTLDSRTHYIELEPFLNEIKRKDRNLEWLKQEIESEKQHFKKFRRKFKGLHFYYTFAQQDVAIDDVDVRPISEIPLSQEVEVRGKICKTVLEYLKAKYRGNPLMRNLDETQSGLKGGNYAYPPQYLHRSVDLQRIDDLILNEQTFHIDTRGQKGKKDINRPAKIRWSFITKYLQKYFAYIDLGPLVAKFKEPCRFPLSNHFDKPRLMTGSERPITFEDLRTELTKGPYKDPRISAVYLYSVLDKEESTYNNQFYGIIRHFTRNRMGISLPESPIPLDKDIYSVETYLERSRNIRGALDGACLAIINEESPLHDKLATLFGTYGLPVKFVTKETAVDICISRRSSWIENICASMVARSGGVPWILYDKLNFGCYAAVDIGRTKSECWALSVVYDRSGLFEIRPGQVTIGEALDEESIEHCVSEALRYAPKSEDLIFLKDGDVYEKEKTAFEKCTKQSSLTNCAIASIKKNVPHRIFREVNHVVAKPLSGDYYFLDELTAVLCTSGVDEYKHGMPKPVVVQTIPIKGEIQPLKVVQDVFYLTYLNWGSPRRSYSLPAPVRLAHTLASELSAGIRRAGRPF